MKSNNIVMVTLQEPVILADYNKARELPADHETSEIEVKRLKYKHVRELQSVAEADQMHVAILKLTGLSEADLDELDAEDVAEITGIVFGFMKKFMKLAGSMMKAAEGVE